MRSGAGPWEVMAMMRAISGPSHPQRAGESRAQSSTMGRQTESECKRVNICNSSMWPAAFPQIAPARPRCTPTRSFLIMNNALENTARRPQKNKKKKPVRSLTNSSAMSEATSGEVRQGGQERRGEERRKERGWTQRASGPGVYSSPSRCAAALEAIFGHSPN